jgi:hypothetical protein
MNDHIKALFIQAGGSVEEENGNLWTYSDDLDPELFAQLVVRECANIATINAHQWASPGTYILKHFGVKE